MWFRIELNKDGSISTCTHVEAECKDGKYIRYVEAVDKEAACKKVIAWFLNERAVGRAGCAAFYDRIKDDGLCVKCRQHKARKNKKLCQACADAHAECEKKRRAAQHAGTYVKPLHYTPIAERTPEQVAAAALKCYSHIKTKNTMRKAVGYTSTLCIKLATLRRVQEAFESRTPAQFAKWLRNEIAPLDAKRQASLVGAHLQPPAP